MSERLPINPSPAEKLSPTHERLVAYLQSLPVHKGEGGDIQGQVQIEVKDSHKEVEDDVVYQESAIYGYELEGNTFVFRATNPEGRIVTYCSIDSELRTFTSENGTPYKVNFPGFVG